MTCPVDEFNLAQVSNYLLSEQAPLLDSYTDVTIVSKLLEYIKSIPAFLDPPLRDGIDMFSVHTGKDFSFLVPYVKECSSSFYYMDIKYTHDFLMFLQSII